jgi:hypothetical protein
MGHRRVLQRLRQAAAKERAQSARQRAGERVPRKDFGASRGWNNVGERSLFDREKRPNFIAAWTDDADGTSDNKKEQIAGARESQARGCHENRTDDQHAPPSNAIRSGCQVQRDDHVAHQGQRKHQAGLPLREPETNQIEN